MASGLADKSNVTNKIRSPLASFVGTSLPNLENYLPRLCLIGAWSIKPLGRQRGEGFSNIRIPKRRGATRQLDTLRSP